MDNRTMSKALEIKDYLTAMRRHFHQHPELGSQEFETTEFIKKELRAMGVTVEPLTTETGVLATISGEKAGEPHFIALRADIDALPIAEQSELPYRSQTEGRMHACGHDGHAAILLGTARLLHSLKNEFSGTVKLIFQPAEETLRGASDMVAAGVLEHPAVDTIVALHGGPEVELGKIVLKKGAFMASADKFVVTIIGVGGHGAYPHRSRDPIVAAAAAIGALQSIVSRRIDTAEQAVLSVCTLSGGTAFNIIPDEVTFSGTVRCHRPQLQKMIHESMEEVLRGVTAAHGCDYRLEYTYGVPALINDGEVIDQIAVAAVQVLGEDSVVTPEKPLMGAEDYAFYVEKIKKGAMFRLGLTPRGQTPYGLHNSKFDFNDEALPIGAAILTQFVLDQNG